MGKFLDPIKCYCWHNELPPLTALAVNKDTGKPSHQLPGVADYGTAQREVFQHSWSDIPPTPQDLQEAQDAFKRAHLG
ncbi:MAG: hypothetical protein F4X54_02680 [Chloroflexi bacterium]|nr:hypothetical protein [Chloroflexota bacterium]MYB83650.1 hypothetical protein [Chloroflexota bacterium]